MKIIFFLLLSLSLMGCSRQAPEHKIMLQNVYGEIISWQKYPVVFHFHKDYPADKKEIVKQQIKEFNQLAGIEVFSLSLEDYSSQRGEDRKDGKNVLYWDFNEDFKMDQFEQGKASIHWEGDEIKEADINIQSNIIIQVDFATLIRHELLHTLGVKHNHHELMNSHLPAYTVRNWDEELIAQWKVEVSLPALKKVNDLKEEARLASQ